MPTKRDKRLFGLAELLATELNKSKGDVQPEDILSFMQCNVPISEEESSEEYDDMMKDRWERPAGRGTSAMARLRKSLGFADGDSLIRVLEKAADVCDCGAITGGEIIEENMSQSVYVAFKPCGCAVSVDLDSRFETRIAWNSNGYSVRSMEKREALNMLRCSVCLHR